MASTQRQLQIAKTIKNEDTRVLVINRKGSHTSAKAKSENIKVSGVFEGIEYVYSSGTPLYPKNFVVRNFLKVCGLVGEFFIIVWNRLTKNATCAIVSSSDLFLLKYYWMLSRVLKIKIVYDYVEYFASLEDRSITETKNEKNFDTNFHHYADAFIIISSFLEEHVKKLSTKPYLIVPPIIDFEKYSKIESKPSETNYFLYCASTFYMDVIYFIIDAYRKSASSSRGVALILVINGDNEKIALLKRSIAEDILIKIVSYLPYDMLVAYYKNARALLIPLQENLQDKARFPFKISEYTAAGRLVITSDYGEVPKYFEDGTNALFAKPGDVNDFSSKLNFVLNNPEKAETIAKNGHELGVKVFNYKSYIEKISEFLRLNCN